MINNKSRGLKHRDQQIVFDIIPICGEIVKLFIEVRFIYLRKKSYKC